MRLSNFLSFGVGAHSRMGAYSRGRSFVKCRKFDTLYYYLQALLRTNKKVMTTKQSVAYLHMHNILLIWIFVLKFQINFHFRGLKDRSFFERWVLVRGGRLLDIPVSRVGAYSRGRLIEALRYKFQELKFPLLIFYDVIMTENNRNS